MKGTISGNEGKSMMKIIVDADSDRVLGMHMVGTDSPEIMQARSRLSLQESVAMQVRPHMIWPDRKPVLGSLVTRHA